MDYPDLEEYIERYMKLGYSENEAKNSLFPTLMPEEYEKLVITETMKGNYEENYFNFLPFLIETKKEIFAELFIRTFMNEKNALYNLIKIYPGIKKIMNIQEFLEVNNIYDGLTGTRFPEIFDQYSKEYQENMFNDCLKKGGAPILLTTQKYDELPKKIKRRTKFLTDNNTIDVRGTINIKKEKPLYQTSICDFTITGYYESILHRYMNIPEIKHTKENLDGRCSLVYLNDKLIGLAKWDMSSNFLSLVSVKKDDKFLLVAGGLYSLEKDGEIVMAENINNYEYFNQINVKSINLYPSKDIATIMKNKNNINCVNSRKYLFEIQQIYKQIKKDFPIDKKS